MPEAAPWKSNIPDVLKKIRESGKTVFLRSDVSEVLGVRDRAAQMVMEAAGTVPSGKARAVEIQSLLRYVESKLTPAAKQEMNRRQRLASKLVQNDHDFRMSQVGLEVSPETKKKLLTKSRWKWSEIPQGLNLEKGRLVVECSGVIDLFSKLFLFTNVVGDNFEEAEEIVSGERMFPGLKAQKRFGFEQSRDEASKETGSSEVPREGVERVAEGGKS